MPMPYKVKLPTYYMWARFFFFFKPLLKKIASQSETKACICKTLRERENATKISNIFMAKAHNLSPFYIWKMNREKILKKEFWEQHWMRFSNYLTGNNLLVYSLFLFLSSLKFHLIFIVFFRDNFLLLVTDVLVHFKQLKLLLLLD